MRNVVAFVHVSLDGFAAGPEGELDWIAYDDELEKHAEGIVSSVGVALYGRVTYQMMESYWPTVLTEPASSKHDMAHARWLEDIGKVVFSRTLKKVDWNNAKLIEDDIAVEMSKLKRQPGKDLVIFGSPNLVQTFLRLDLIDEYQLTVSPVVLGKGTPLFNRPKDKINLKLLESKTFKSGALGLHYRTERKP